MKDVLGPDVVDCGPLEVGVEVRSRRRLTSNGAV
jgi:hypothetical protein